MFIALDSNHRAEDLALDERPTYIVTPTPELGQHEVAFAALQRADHWVLMATRGRYCHCQLIEGIIGVLGDALDACRPSNQRLLILLTSAAAK